MYSYTAVLENWRKQSVAFTMHTLSVSDFPDWSHLVCPERGFQAVTHVMSLLQLFLIMTVVYHALLAQEHAPMHSHKHICRLRQMQIDTQIDTCMQTHTCTGTHRNRQTSGHSNSLMLCYKRFVMKQEFLYIWLLFIWNWYQMH